MDPTYIFNIVKQCIGMAHGLILYLNDKDLKGVVIKAQNNTHFRVSVTGTKYELSIGFPVDRNEGTATIVEMAIYHGGKMVSRPELGYDEFQYFDNPKYSDILSDILSEIYRLRDALCDIENQVLDEVVGPDISELDVSEVV